jgi:ribosomal-protein-alanine N-acetyltransferase
LSSPLAADAFQVPLATCEHDCQAGIGSRKFYLMGATELTIAIGAVYIETSRFFLRQLAVDDVSNRYLSWFGDSVAKKWISTAAYMRGLSDLREYVQQRVGREDVLFLGIFSKADGLHIGNIKFEPISKCEGWAEMGVLIGDPDFRGKRVFAEVLAASVGWLKINMQIERICLGVEIENAPGLTAYRNAGFVIDLTSKQSKASGMLRMVLYL